MIRAIIVDDEPLAREGLRDFLAAEPDVDIVSECGDGKAAARAIREHKPDLVFLDVQMPEMDGFELLGNLEPEEIPNVIFVTAYDRYALEAFRVHALDYLLQPLVAERFRAAVQRVRTHMLANDAGRINERMLTLLGELRDTSRGAGRLLIKERGRIFFVKAEEVDWIEAAGNYVKLHVGAERHLMRETMSKIGDRLDRKQFARIHRSTIVNLDRIKEIQPWFQGEHVVVLHTGVQLTLSRTYREKLQKSLGMRL